jgi:hypothetical protein
VAGQTGQDGAASAKAGDQVAETKDRKAEKRIFTANPRLGLEDRLGQIGDTVEGEGHHANLDQAEEDQKDSHDQADYPAGEAGEGHLSKDRTTTQCYDGPRVELFDSRNRPLFTRQVSS